MFNRRGSRRTASNRGKYAAHVVPLLEEWSRNSIIVSVASPECASR
jgi:hypothetical protein